MSPDSNQDSDATHACFRGHDQSRRLLPTYQGNYQYTDSLTTPLCTQGLDWIVYKSSIQLSADLQATFAKIYPKNNPSTQPLNNRDVLEEDSTGPNRQWVANV